MERFDEEMVLSAISGYAAREGAWTAYRIAVDGRVFYEAGAGLAFRTFVEKNLANACEAGETAREVAAAFAPGVAVRSLYDAVKQSTKVAVLHAIDDDGLRDGVCNGWSEFCKVVSYRCGAIASDVSEQWI